MTKGNAPFAGIRQGSRAGLGAIFVALLFAASARAQGDPERVTLLAGIGTGQSWRDESTNGVLVNLFAGAELRLFRGVGILVDVSRASHRRQFDFGRKWHGSDVIASASVVGRLGKRRVQPYFLVGVSFVHSELQTERPVFDYGFSPSTGSLVGNIVDTDRTRTSTNDFGPSFGGGADVHLHPRVVVRTEARFYSSSSLKLALTASLGFTYRW